MEPPPMSRAWRTLVIVLFRAYALIETHLTFGPLLGPTPHLAVLLVALLTLAYVINYTLSDDPALALIAPFAIRTPCLARMP
jgi:hypothetical protein